MSFGAAKSHNVQPNRIARQTRSGQFGAQFPQLGVTAFPMLSRMSRIHPISGGKWDWDVDNERPLTSKFASAIHLTESTGVMLHTASLTDQRMRSLPFTTTQPKVVTQYSALERDDLVPS